MQWELYWTVVLERELSWRAKLWIYQSNYVPTLTYDHELWFVTITRSLIQAAGLSFLCRVAGLLGAKTLSARIRRFKLRKINFSVQAAVRAATARNVKRTLTPSVWVNFRTCLTMTLCLLSWPPPFLSSSSRAAGTAACWFTTFTETL